MKSVQNWGTLAGLTVEQSNALHLPPNKLISQAPYGQLIWQTEKRGYGIVGSRLIRAFAVPPE